MMKQLLSDPRILKSVPFLIVTTIGRIIIIERNNGVTFHTCSSLNMASSAVSMVPSSFFISVNVGG